MKQLKQGTRIQGTCIYLPLDPLVWE